MDNTVTAEQLEAKAAQCFQDREDSFDRCDTDGFLSQWASGLTGQLYQTQAELKRAGDQAEFAALFYLDGRRAPAKLITVKDKFRGYGTRQCWALLDRNWKFTGEFVSRPATELYDVYDEAMGCNVQKSRVTKRSAANLAKKGYMEGREMAPAKAEIIGTGHGLSGSAWVATLRADRGCPAEAVENQKAK